MAAPSVKRARAGLLPHDLAVGQAVLYGEGQEGVVTDALQHRNMFIVRSRATHEIVRGEDGEAVAFRSEQLRLAPVSAGGGAKNARVLVIGSGVQMLRIIQYFGAPDCDARHAPQLLLGIPCTACLCASSCQRFGAGGMCDPSACPLLTTSMAGVEPQIFELARRLRPDLHDKIGIRAFHLKHALEQLGPDLVNLQGYYCLASVSLPYEMREVDSAPAADRGAMAARCHIDLDATAEGPSQAGEASLAVTAQRVVGVACGVTIADYVWDEAFQLRVREALSVKIPLSYDDADTKGFVLILPPDLPRQEGTVLRFHEPARESDAWSQEEFRDMPAPPGWMRAVSTSTGRAYYYHPGTDVSCFEYPTVRRRRAAVPAEKNPS